MSERSVPRVVIAGTGSGVGKTTFTLGLIAAFQARGLRVQPFKCGPDYLDPTYHTLAASLPCRNLDTWMLTPEVVTGLFDHAVAGADVAVIEGVMGLHDGRGGERERGSTAEVAKLLRAPVLLVIDTARLSRSAGAMALGYQAFDPEVWIAGVLFNRVGSDRHRRWVAEGISERTRIPVMGYLPKQAPVALPQRHLGLVPAREVEGVTGSLAAIREQVEATVDIEGILTLARAVKPISADDRTLFPERLSQARVRIGLAHDAAFGFYYQDNLDLLRAWGAELVIVSPLRDHILPPDLHGLYIGGGFPELHARELAANRSLRQQIAEAAGDGMPVYAECGGLMYLAESLVDLEGQQHGMVGAVPGTSVMQRSMVRMGYVTATAVRDSILARAGVSLMGHEFHWSSMAPPDPRHAAYRISEDGDRLEGIVAGSAGNILASYLHLHFGSDLRLMHRFLERCRVWRRAATADASVMEG
jgi:cobyrinic acid a,c-diamide synthase